MPEENVEQEAKEIKKNDKKNKLEAAPEDPITIMPTMIDDREIVQEKRRDLKAMEQYLLVLSM